MGGVFDGEEVFEEFGVQDLGDLDQVVEEESEDAHSLLDLPGQTFGCLFIGDRWDDQGREELSQCSSEPDKITVSSSDVPVDF